MQRPTYSHGPGLLIISLMSVICLTTSIVAAATPTAEQYKREGLKFSRNGCFEEAVANELQACRLYEKAGSVIDRIDALVELGRAYEALGRHRKALEAFDTALGLTQGVGDRIRTAVVSSERGNVLCSLGSFDEAETKLNEALKLASQENDPLTRARSLDYLGLVREMQERYPEAVICYQEALSLADKANDAALEARLQVRAASAFLLSGKTREARSHFALGLEKYRQLPDTHAKATGLILLGQAYGKLASSPSGDGAALGALARDLLAEAMATAEAIGDQRALSYACGYLGQLFEDKHQEEDALRLTRRAVFAAQQIEAIECLYLWEWQLGRVFNAQGKMDQAIEAYRSAVQSLQSIRREMSANCPSCGRSPFREQVEPVFFQLADLLLQRSDTCQKQKDASSYLFEAREIIEMLKVSELQDYFQDPCVAEYQTKREHVEDIAVDAVVIYSITFPKRLDLLVSSKSGIKKFSIPVDSRTLSKEARALRVNLEKRATWDYLPHSRKLYDWVLRPLEAELNSRKVKTLVFVPDGALRTISLGALHDGRQFVIERFAVVTTPGLNLLDPRPIPRKNVKVLSAGLSEAVHGFSALTNVEGELNGIQTLYRTDRFENKDFLAKNLDRSLKATPYSIVHIATHGEFAHRAEETFLLTWDSKIDMNRLDQLMKQCQFRKEPVELLTLSACQTAAGDDRAALGLAGVAIKAGARSAIATLWNVSDQAASDLVIEFYRQIRDPSISKARALQLAQQKLLGDPHYRHPFYWSPFLLIGNWL